MELTGESRIAARRDAVWRALTDPAIFARCVGGGSPAADAPGIVRLAGPIALRVGGEAATVTAVTLDAAGKPDRGRIAAEADDGGVIAANLALTDDDAATLLRYAVSAGGGAVDRLDPAVADDVARGYAAAFVARLEAALAAADPVATRAPASPGPAARSVLPADPGLAGDPDAPADPGLPTDDARQLHGSRVATGLTPLVWGGVIVMVVLAVLVWQLA